MLSGKWRPFCLGLNVYNEFDNYTFTITATSSGTNVLISTFSLLFLQNSLQWLAHNIKSYVYVQPQVMFEILKKIDAWDSGH